MLVQSLALSQARLLLLGWHFIALSLAVQVSCANLYKTLNVIGLLSTKAYPGIWYQTSINPNDFKY